MSQLICINCQNVFAKALKSQSAASHLSQILDCTVCDAETHSTTPDSPGVVTNDEFVAACACHPNQVLEDGSLSPDIVEHAYTIGMSVSRLSKIDSGEAQVMAFCSKIFSGKGSGKRGTKIAVGIAVVKAGDVRSISYVNGDQAFIVYDTASKGMEFHADIFATDFFGALERLSAQDQAIRLSAQMALVEKMDFKPNAT